MGAEAFQMLFCCKKSGMEKCEPVSLPPYNLFTYLPRGQQKHPTDLSVSATTWAHSQTVLFSWVEWTSPICQIKSWESIFSNSMHGVGCCYGFNLDVQLGYLGFAPQNVSLSVKAPFFPAVPVQAGIFFVVPFLNYFNLNYTLYRRLRSIATPIFSTQWNRECLLCCNVLNSLFGRGQIVVARSQALKHGPTGWGHWEIYRQAGTNTKVL